MRAPSVRATAICMAQQARAETHAVPALVDADVEQVRFVEHHHDDCVADEFAADAADPGTVAGSQRIGEVATRPWKRIDGVLDRQHVIEIARVHRQHLDTRASTALMPCLLGQPFGNRQRDLVTDVTGTASAASRPSPRSRRGAARLATAAAVGGTSGRSAVQTAFIRSASTG